SSDLQRNRSTMDNDLATALEHHRAGLLDPARGMYQGVLVRQPDHADALHLLGVLEHQCGQHARAADLIGRAIARNPAAPAYHANLAEVYPVLGRLDRPVAACRTALGLPPHYPEAANNLA